MKTLALYLGMAAIGYIVGNKTSKGKHYTWPGKLQSAAILGLVFFMGTNIGSDERVVVSLGTIGLKALLITLGAIGGSVCFAHIARRLVKLNRKGLGENE